MTHFELISLLIFNLLWALCFPLNPLMRLLLTCGTADGADGGEATKSH